MKRVVLVVGASSGIGRATAHLLAARGDHLVLASRSEESLAETGDECRVRGAASVDTAVLDVGDAGAVEAAVDGVVARHGRLDAVVVTAAVMTYGRLDHVPADVLDGLLTTNVLGSAHVARAAVRVFREQGAGTLVLTGSLLGRVTSPGMTPYVMSKFAVRGLANQLQLELKDCPGVSVVLVAPGAVDTPIYRLAANYDGNELRPPPPVMSAEKVAARVVRSLDQPHREVSIGPLNPVMRAAFALVPAVYERLAIPLGQVLGKRNRPWPRTDGNVLEPHPELEAVSGGQVGGG